VKDLGVYYNFSQAEIEQEIGTDGRPLQAVEPAMV
jgi:hypothetical protein